MTEVLSDETIPSLPATNASATAYESRRFPIAATNASATAYESRRFPIAATNASATAYESRHPEPRRTAHGERATNASATAYESRPRYGVNKMDRKDILRIIGLLSQLVGHLEGRDKLDTIEGTNPLPCSTELQRDIIHELKFLKKEYEIR